MKIKDILPNDRPREKLKLKGPESLSDFELLQALIGSGNKQANVSNIAKEILKIIKQYRLNINYDQLKQIVGMGSAKITEMLAAIELSKRYLVDSENPIIDSPEKAVLQLTDIRDKKQEYFMCLTLDGANRLIAKRIVSIGTLNSSLSHPREVFADALTDRAAGIIVAHNHPSNINKPSENDLEITKRLYESGKILGVNLIDHIIMTKNDFFSFKKNGLLNVDNPF